MLRAGCGAFPVAHSTYFAALDTLEAGGPGGRLPRPETAERWRREAPSGFVFSVRCAGGVAEERFRPTDAVRQAWSDTLRVASALDARFVVFETPAVFHPSAAHLQDFYAFFRSMERGEKLLVWQPARGWGASLVRRVCGDLRLILAVDPIIDEPAAGAVNYFRLRGAGPGRKAWRGHRYTDEELRRIANSAGGTPTYAYFLTADMWEDARRLSLMTRPHDPRGYWRSASPRGGDAR